MSYTYTFAHATTIDTAWFDEDFNEAGRLGTTPCHVTGTNTLVLTPFTATEGVGAPTYVLQVNGRISFIAAHSNTGAVTANVATTGAYPVYKDSAAGPVALSGGEIVADNYVVLVYDATLGSGAGGYHLDNGLVGGAPSGSAGGDLSGTYPNPTVAKINGVALGTTTATSGAILIGSGTAWVRNSVSGDASLSSAGALTVTKTGGVNFSGLATATFVTPTTWTPADGSGAALSFSSVSASYTRIGNLIFCGFSFVYPATADGSAAIISGLPVAVPNQTYAQGPCPIWASGGSIAPLLHPVQNTSTAAFVNAATGAAVTNANLSGLTIRGMLIYPAA